MTDFTPDEVESIVKRLEKVDFLGLNLSKRDLHAANLWDANLMEVKLSDAKYNGGTRWPSGFEPGAGWSCVGGNDGWPTGQ